VAEVLLFHHAQGQTVGFLAFAEELRQAGHTVHTPALYDGHTFEDLDDGVAYAGEVGFGAVRERGVQAADALPSELVYDPFFVDEGDIDAACFGRVDRERRALPLPR
jgi:hypothetical protein